MSRSLDARLLRAAPELLGSLVGVGVDVDGEQLGLAAVYSFDELVSA